MSTEELRKAVEALGKVLAFAGSENQADWQTIRQALRDQEAEIARLRKIIDDKSEHSHRCKRCLYPYTPKAGQSEDCPECGFDGITAHLGGENND